MITVVINGKGGAGKDTFIKLCSRYTGVISHSSVYWVKQAAEVLGWTGGKHLADRKFLSDLKDLSTWYNDGPFESLKDIYEKANKPHVHCDILFLHVREPNEIERCVREFDAKTLLIRRPTSNEGVYGNHADDCVENFNYDYIVDNDGSIEDLEEQAKEFILKLGLTI